MSTWGDTKTSGFLFSAQDDGETLKWLRSQILLRGVQTYRNTPTIEKAQFIPMQANLEVGVDTESIAIVSTVGFRANDASKELKEFFSRRHYALYRFSEHYSARLGKFMRAFGLNGPDHISATRRGLSFDQGSESYNLEMNYTGETFNHSVTLGSSLPEDRGAKKDEGISFDTSYFWKNHSRFGVSVYHGRQSDSERLVLGPYFTISFSDKLYLSSEVFYQDKLNKAGSTRAQGYATFSRLGYEAYKGVLPFVQFDRASLQSSDLSSQFDSYGLGLQWLPYPHFDFMVFAGKEAKFAQAESDFSWLMLNIYL